MVDLIGQTVGQYRIIEQIGQGGMATVYKAYQPSLDRYVAVKVLPPYFAHEPGFAERFTREAKAIARLNHPNILPIYDFGQQGDLSYIVMKYVEAGTLKDILGTPLALDVTADIVRQIAAALDHAHQRGILHRDVKPSNVLLDEGRWVLLTDFGLAKMIEGSVALTGSGVGVGTPAYMSPEQGRGETVDVRADIYSLGVVLYEMLTGRVPFEAETPMAVVIKHITDPLPLPRSINPQLPEAIERVILKALAKDPADRFVSTLALADATTASATVSVKPAPKTVELAPSEPPPAPPLEKAPEPSPVPPVPAVEAAPPARRGFPWKIVAAVAGIIVLALLAVLVASNLGKEETKKTPTAAAAATATFTRPAPTRPPQQEPTPTKPPRPGDELRNVQFQHVYFKSDFEQPDEVRFDFPAGWQIGDDGSGNHVLIGIGPAPPLSFPGSADWVAYDLEARIRLAEGGEASVAVRYTEDKDAGTLLVCALDRWVLVQQPQEEMVDVYPDVNNKDEWHHLRVVVAENRMVAFLDDALMFDAELELPTGKLALNVYQDSAIFIDDLRIAGPLLSPQIADMTLYDDFNQGPLDETRWEWRPGSESDVALVDQDGALVIKASNPGDEPSYGELLALKVLPLMEIQVELTIERLEGGNTDLVIALFAEGRPMAGIIGEQGEMMAFDEQGEKRFLLEGEGLPAKHQLHLTLTPQSLMFVTIDGLAVGDIPAPPLAEGFSIAYRVDPGGALVGRLDNVQIRYVEVATVPTEPPPQTVYSCHDALGCVDISPGKAIHIAYLLDTSGLARFTGADSLRGIELAVEQRGEVLGHPLELSGEDSGCQLDKGHEAAAKIADEPSVLAIVGPTCSAVAVFVAPIFNQAGQVIVSPTNTKPMLTDPDTHNPAYLRVAPNDQVQAGVAAEFAREALGVQSAATLYSEDSYTQALQQLFAEAFQSLGGELTAQEQVTNDEAEVLRALELVAQTRPQLIFYPLFVETGGLVTRLARQIDSLQETHLMGADGMFSAEFLTIAGEAANNLYLTNPDIPTGSSEYRSFLESYVKRYGNLPQGASHAYAYDATMMILTAIEQTAVQDEDGTLHIGRLALRNALYATRGFEGLTGNLNCTATGDCAEARVSVYQVTNPDPATWEPGNNPTKVWP